MPKRGFEEEHVETIEKPRKQRKKLKNSSKDSLERLIRKKNAEKLQFLFWKYCKNGNVENLRKLLDLDKEKLVDVDLQNHQGLNGLMLSCKAGHLQAVEVLLQRGTSLNVPFNGETALDIACNQDHGDVVSLLLQYQTKSLFSKLTQLARNVIGSEPSFDKRLLQAVQRGNASVVHALLSHPDTIYQGKDSTGLTLFNHAIKSFRPQIVELILGKGHVEQDEINRAFLLACKDGEHVLIQTLMPYVQSNRLLIKEGVEWAQESQWMDIVAFLNNF